VSAEPVGSKAANAGERLAIQQRDVSIRGNCLNGKPIATLSRNREPKLFYYAVPARTLRDGYATIDAERRRHHVGHYLQPD
jgi:hypothetical protein